jgi:hypothetical protein
MQEWSDYVTRVSKHSVLIANKERQMAAIDDSRPPERETSVYQTIHNLEIPNLAITVSAASTQILFPHWFNPYLFLLKLGVCWTLHCY